MKPRTVAVAFLPVLLVALLLSGCVTMEPERGALMVQKEIFVQAPNEGLYGTWVNPDLRPPVFYPRLVVHPWGLYEAFQTLTSRTYAWRGTSAIVEKWTDAEGNTWYKEFVRCSLKGFYTGHAFYLERLSRDGNTLECIFGNIGWPRPSDMDPETNTTYAKYTRQE